ncbi:hypothetical protein Sste5346_000361 [Sporothrix stenoceras]|uniref:RING-type E3 ubiquitin transferase n=1 Tax=Sporothrix stenoceras TaxID=5173 RepID=A0ABR3ZSE9_9PEZI
MSSHHGEVDGTAASLSPSTLADDNNDATASVHSGNTTILAHSDRSPLGTEMEPEHHDAVETAEVTAPVTEDAPAQETVSASPAPPTPPAPEPAASTNEHSLPIRQPSRPVYRPPSPPLPPIPVEWQNPPARRGPPPPAPLPPFPEEWTVRPHAQTARSQPRRPTAAGHARTQSSSISGTSGTSTIVAGARRTSMAGSSANSPNPEPPLPPAPPVGYESRPMPRPQQPQQPQQPQRPGFVVPRWQPDSEVTFIVQPPGSQPYQIQAAGSQTGLAGDMSYLGGGERVRLCNPCVPDPNTAPPSATGPAAGSSNRYHSRSFSTAHGHTNVRYAAPGGAANPLQYFTTGPVHAVPTTGTSAATSSSSSASAQNRNRHNRLSLPPMSGTAALVSADHDSAQQYISQLQQGYQQQPHHPYHAHGHRSRQPQQPPPQPQPQIAEEDECPICRRELPRHSLPNFETLREAHITECLEEHSRIMGGGRRSSNNNNGGNATGMSTSLPSNVAEASSSTAPPAPPRMTGMFPYRATEKDCVDSAECTICLEDFEVGVRMARLECFCRFHEKCIRSWFEKHPGRCPVHQHDSFGY